MIIDYKNDRAAAELFSVFDAETGECLDHAAPYWYADDRAGIVRRYDTDERGSYFLRHRASGFPVRSWRESGPDRPDDPDVEVSWSEERRPIRIEPRADLDRERLRVAQQLMASG